MELRTPIYRLRNLEAMPLDPEEAVLTGGMVIWAYLVVFPHLHGRTRKICARTDEGRGSWWPHTAELVGGWTAPAAGGA